MKFIVSLFTKKQRTLATATLILMFMVVGSGILGLIRLRILYHNFTPEETGIFFAAFRLPNLIFEFLALGAVTSAFIPVFTKYLTKDLKDEADIMASTIINIVLAVFVVISIPLFIWTRQISSLIAPGFNDTQITQMVAFTRMMLLLQVVPLVLGNFFTGMLHSYNLFLIPALAPILYNLGIIIGILFFANSLGLFSAVLGVGIGAFLFLIIHFPLVFYIKFRYKLIFRFKHAGVVEAIRMMVPRVVGLSVNQIDITIDYVLASLLGPKMISVFFLAQSLQQLPSRLFGTTVSQAALPTLSSSSALDDKNKFKTILLSAYNMILFFIFPISLWFIVLRVPLVRLIFGASRFDWEATVLTAYTLSAFSISLFAQAIGQLFVRGFYALYDSKTPVKIGIFTVIINALLSVIFIIHLKLPIWSLGLSTSIASIIHALLLMYLIDKRVGGFSRNEFVVKPIKIFIIAFFSAVAIYLPLKLFDELIFDTTRVFGLLFLVVFVGLLGVVVYVFLSWVFGISEVKRFWMFLNRVRKAKIIVDSPQEIISPDSSDSY